MLNSFHKFKQLMVDETGFEACALGSVSQAISHCIPEPAFRRFLNTAEAQRISILA